MSNKNTGSSAGTYQKKVSISKDGCGMYMSEMRFQISEGKVPRQMEANKKGLKVNN